MADNAKKLSELPQANTLHNNCYVVVLSNTTVNATSGAITNAETKIVKMSNFFSNVQTLQLAVGNAPANSTANVVSGQFWTDGDYLYYATANNTIKRVTLDSF